MPTGKKISFSPKAARDASDELLRFFEEMRRQVSGLTDTSTLAKVKITGKGDQKSGGFTPGAGLSSTIGKVVATGTAGRLTTFSDLAQRLHVGLDRAAEQFGKAEDLNEVAAMEFLGLIPDPVSAKTPPPPASAGPDL